MVDKISVEELLKEKKILEDKIVKDVEQDIKKFHNDTGFGLRSVIVYMDKNTYDVQYVICDIALE